MVWVRILSLWSTMLHWIQFMRDWVMISDRILVWDEARLWLLWDTNKSESNWVSSILARLSSTAPADWQNNPKQPSRINSFKDVFYISSQEFITYPRSILIKFLHKIKKCMDQSICRCFSASIKWTVRIHIHINTFQRLQSAAASATPFPPQFWLKFFFYIFIFTLRNN